MRTLKWLSVLIVLVNLAFAANYCPDMILNVNNHQYAQMNAFFEEIADSIDSAIDTFLNSYKNQEIGYIIINNITPPGEKQ